MSHRWWRTVTGAVLGLVVVAAVVLLFIGKPHPAPTEAAVCADLDRPVYQSVDLPGGATTLSTDEGAVSRAVNQGQFDRGVPFSAAGHPGAGLVAVRLLIDMSTGDRMYLTDPTTLASAQANPTVVDRGIAFFVLGAPESCTAPVYALTRNGRHQYAVSDNIRADLAGEGWRTEGVAFYGSTEGARPPIPVTAPGDMTMAAGPGQFSIAAVPDTQQEVLSAADLRFASRMGWLADQRTRTNLRFVAHVGDVVNWDTSDHRQWVQAQLAMRQLNAAGIPCAIAPGNHDAEATCVGGAACPGTDARVAVRETGTFNRYFPRSQFAAVGGQFEPGKMDNAYHRFTVGRSPFMVINLELWPRPQVVSWAASVIRSHPEDNVVILTHYYLTATGVISAADDYGQTSPAELDRRLVQPFPNVKLVLSGHVGTGASKVVDRRDGSKVVYLMQTFHDNQTNPVRMILIDLKKGTLRSRVFAPSKGLNYPRLAVDVSGMSWR